MTLYGVDWAYQLYGNSGHDRLYGEAGIDRLSGGEGDDYLWGGAERDYLNGETGNDYLAGDAGAKTAKGFDFGADALYGGAGDDRLIQSEGNDLMNGGGGYDTFAFKWSDPSSGIAATPRGFTTIADFVAQDDVLTFDVAGVGGSARGANFVDGGAGDGTAGGAASSFYSGAAAGSNGEAVMILDDQAFATAEAAVTAANGEAAGDLIIYFNSTVNAASLLYVDGANAAHSFARFASISSLATLQNTNFTAGDFWFV
jgi:Ca2+-binding RTX toxin-like protein